MEAIQLLPVSYIRDGAHHAIVLRDPRRRFSVAIRYHERATRAELEAVADQARQRLRELAAALAQPEPAITLHPPDRP